MEYAVPIKIESLGGGEGYAATSDNFPGFLAHGKTIEETVRKADIVLRSMLKAYEDKGVEPPIRTKKVNKIEIDMPLEIEEEPLAA